MTNVFVKFAILAAAAVCVFVGVSWAQGGVGQPADTLANVSVNNSTLVDTSAGSVSVNNDTPANTSTGNVSVDNNNAPADTSADTSAAQVSVDNLDGTDDIDDDDDLALADIPADSAKAQFTKPNLIRREYDYKRQTRLAIVMMAFIAVLMATSQSWNPR